MEGDNPSRVPAVLNLVWYFVNLSILEAFISFSRNFTDSAVLESY